MQWLCHCFYCKLTCMVLIQNIQWQWKHCFLRVLYLICVMLLEVNYFTADEGKSLICRVFIEADKILFCSNVEIHIIQVRIFSNTFFKSVLSDLELSIFIVAQPWWVTFEISFAVIFISKIHKSKYLLYFFRNHFMEGCFMFQWGGSSFFR